MAYVTYTTTPVTHVSLPLLYPYLLISPVASVGTEKTSRTAHPSAFSATAAGQSRLKISHGAPVLLPTTTLRTPAVIPAVYVAPRNYCVCVSPYQSLRVWSSCVPAGYVIGEASRWREMKDKAETRRHSPTSGNAIKPVPLTRGTEPSHNCRPSSTKRGSQQSQISQYFRANSQDDKHFFAQKRAAQRSRTACSRSGRGLPRELGSAAKKKEAAHLYGTNVERPQNGPSFYSSEVPKRAERKLKNGGYHRKAARTSAPRQRHWTLEGQLDVDGTVELT